MTLIVWSSSINVAKHNNAGYRVKKMPPSHWKPLGVIMISLYPQSQRRRNHNIFQGDSKKKKKN